MRILLCSFVVCIAVYVQSCTCMIPTSVKRLVTSNRIVRIVTRMASSEDVPKSVEGWRTKLSPNQFAVLRQAATEPPGFSEKTPGELEYDLKQKLGTKYPKDGIFECVGCGTPLYKASSKFDSGCGWPAFFEGIDGKILEKKDPDGRRVEILCNNCGSHLGHVFKGEGFPTPTNERHCVNGICLKYKPV